MAMVGSLLVPAGILPCFFLDWLISWLVMHRLAIWIAEFSDRYLNRAPKNVYAYVSMVKNEDK
jgi:hypothetical protein